MLIHSAQYPTQTMHTFLGFPFQRPACFRIRPRSCFFPVSAHSPSHWPSTLSAPTSRGGSSNFCLFYWTCCISLRNYNQWESVRNYPEANGPRAHSMKRLFSVSPGFLRFRRVGKVSGRGTYRWCCEAAAEASLGTGRVSA